MNDENANHLAIFNHNPEAPPPEVISLVFDERVTEWNNWRSANRSRRVSLREGEFGDLTLPGIDFSNVDLCSASFGSACLQGAILQGADLTWADMVDCNLIGANLRGANMRFARLTEARLQSADLSDALVYGVAAWNVHLDGATQTNLVVTPEGDANEITADDLEVAQFLHLLLTNAKIRDVIDTLSTRVVLILGRFTPDRLEILHAIKDALRANNYVPVLFDFQRSRNKTLLGTASLIAHLARFVIADASDAAMIREEVPHLLQSVFIPVQPIIETRFSEPVIWNELRSQFHCLLPAVAYENGQALVASLRDRVIAPAEAKARAIRNYA
jgi:uncharacterized protein YjbI with pentapeptide repeats